MGRMGKAADFCRGKGRVRGRLSAAFGASAFAVALMACLAMSPSSTPSPAAAASPGTGNAIGMNVWFLSDWDGTNAFADAMKHARPWQDGADWHKAVAGVDERGWPSADASTVIGTGTPDMLNGTYRLAFKGQADISILWAPGTVRNKAYDPATNTTTAEVTFNLTGLGNIGLILTNTRRTPKSRLGSGFTDLKLWRPGVPSDGSRVFTEDFLAALEGMAVVRTMDWSVTNQNLLVRWEDRMRPDDMARPGPAYRGPGGGEWERSELGVALEYQVRLANDLDADLWINVPVAADEDFVRKMALALRYGTDGSEPYASSRANPVWPPLEPGRKLYVEYGNEIWNAGGGFECFHVVEDIVRSLPDGHPLFSPEEENIWYLMWRWPAWRMAGISDAFRAVWGEGAMMETVRPVLMTQRGNGQASLEQGLEWMDAYGRALAKPRSVSSWLYAAGGSAYYGARKFPRNHSDLDALFSPGNWPDGGAVADMELDAVWARNYGLERVAYEGGPSLDEFNEVNGLRANADPRMERVILDAHDAWSASGGGLLVYYVARGPHQWEFTPDIRNTDTPKFRALKTLLARARAPVSFGPSLPGTMVAVEQPGKRVRFGTDYPQRVDGKECVGGNDSGEWIALAGHAEAPFEGRIQVEGAASSGARIAVWVNGKMTGTLELPPSEGLKKGGPLAAAIPAGLVVIRLEVLEGFYHLRSVIVE